VFWLFLLHFAPQMHHFERFICGRWYIYLEQTIYNDYHPQWLIIIPSGGLWSPVVEYHLQWLIVISRITHHRWYSSLLNAYRFHRMYIVCSRWISSQSDEYHLVSLKIVCSRWISSPPDEYHLLKLNIVCWRLISYNIANNRPQQMIFNREGW
jgi:hypothetical protein